MNGRFTILSTCAYFNQLNLTQLKNRRPNEVLNFHDAQLRLSRYLISGYEKFLLRDETERLQYYKVKLYLI